MTTTSLFYLQFLTPLFISICFYVSPLRKSQIRILSLVGSITFLLVTWMMIHSISDLSNPTVLFAKEIKGFFGLSYRFYIDGISGVFALLNALLLILVVISTWSFDDNKLKLYFFNIFLITWAVNSCLLAENLYTFFIFWEAMLIPLFVLVGVFGGPNRRYASLKFFIYTAAGSVLMLSAIIYLSFLAYTNFNTYDLTPEILLKIKLPMNGFFSPQSLVFWAFCVAFFIKIPLFPLHTWLPQAHVEAPTAGSIILAGILLKLGGYGVIRFVLPYFPEAVSEYRHVVLILASIGVIYGSLVALDQTDIKKIVAFSSVAHMALIVAGLFSLNMIGLKGALFQMVGHGLTTGGLFICVHYLYIRVHSKELSEMGGLAKKMPIFAACFFIVLIGSMAVPLTNGFVGEFLLLLGVFKTNKIIGILCASGVILCPLYLLKMYQRSMLGALNEKIDKEIKDLSFVELIPVLILIALIIFYGVYPESLMKYFDGIVLNVLKG